MVEDLESSNGTFLNGRRIDGPTLVRSGDTLTIGPATFVVHLDTETEAYVPVQDSGDYPVFEEAFEDAPTATQEDLPD